MIQKTIFAGSGGQGVLMMGYVLAVAVMRDGKHVTYLPSYGAEVRGGTANCTVTVSDQEIASPVASFPDYTVVLNRPSLVKYQGIIRSGGVMFINSSLIENEPDRTDIEIIKIPANEIAHEIGSERSVNMVLLGAFVVKTGITTIESVVNGLKEIMEGKKTAVIELNRKALEKGAACVHT